MSADADSRASARSVQKSAAGPSTLEQFLAEEKAQPPEPYPVGPGAALERDVSRAQSALPEIPEPDWFEPDECRALAEARGDGQWYYKNRFSACLVRTITINFRRCPQCESVGRLTVRATHLGKGYFGQRSLDWLIYLDQWSEPEGTVNMNAPIRFEVECDAYGFGDCNQEPPEPRSLAEAKAGGPFEQWGSPEFLRPAPTDQHPEDEKTWLRYRPVVFSRTVSRAEATAARCDSAAYVNLNGGCVFTRTGAVFAPPDDAETADSVEFLRQAFYDITSLKRSADEYVPGNYNVPQLQRLLNPLTRNFYGNRSRSRVRQACRQLWAADYTTNPSVCKNPTCECDEYPFSSTYQNANYVRPTSRATFVVKPVNAAHNGAVGNHLEAFYKAEHILDGDPFYVSIPRDAPPSTPTPSAAVECFVFADGGASPSAPADALYFAGPERVCIPQPADPAATFCGKWFGCQTVQGKLPVTFQVFDDGSANAVGATAVYVRDVEQACVANDTPTGACRKWFGEAALSDGRRVTCRLFDDGYANVTAATGAIYYREPSRICMPNDQPEGDCRKWFGRCAIQ